MIPLQTKGLPPNADALEESLRRVLRPVGAMVTVEDKDYPQLAAIRILLDGAEAGEHPPPRPSPRVGPTELGLRVESFEIVGRPILVHGAKMNLTCTARDVDLGQGRDLEGNVLLLLQDAAEGQLEIVVGLADLEALVLAGAKAAAAKQGVTVESVRIELRSRSDRALEVAVQVRAKKLFLGATVRINGRVALDEQMNARLSGLECAGEGTLGTLACGFLTPQLQRFDGREFPLTAVSLGAVKLRDVRIAAGRELRVTARFGRAA